MQTLKLLSGCCEDQDGQELPGEKPILETNAAYIRRAGSRGKQPAENQVSPYQELAEHLKRHPRSAVIEDSSGDMKGLNDSKISIKLSPWCNSSRPLKVVLADVFPLWECQPIFPANIVQIHNKSGVAL
jgi:hypothetical protein